jgi:16S rRNA C1402 N4-methylase RsmH
MPTFCLNKRVKCCGYLKPNSIVVDATMGYAGHSSKILEKITNGYLYGFDEAGQGVG